MASLSYTPPNGVFNRLVIVDSIVKLPAPSGGVVTLAPGTAYMFTVPIDLAGSRVSCPGPNAILGTAPELVSLSSTGLDPALPLVEATSNLPLSGLSITHGFGVSVDTSASPQATTMHWSRVNFIGCARSRRRSLRQARGTAKTGCEARYQANHRTRKTPPTMKELQQEGQESFTAGTDPASDGPPVVMLRMRNGAIRYMVREDKADEFKKQMEWLAGFYSDVRVCEEGLPISLESAAYSRATVYFYLGSGAAIEGETLDGEIGHVYRAVFRFTGLEVEFEEYPYALIKGEWSMVGRPIFHFDKVNLYTTAGNPILELLHSK